MIMKAIIIFDKLMMMIYNHNALFSSLTANQASC